MPRMPLSRPRPTRWKTQRREAWEEVGLGSTGESRYPGLTPRGLCGNVSAEMNPMVAGPFIAPGTGEPARGAADPDARLF